MPPARATARAARSPERLVQLRLLGDPALIATDGSIKSLERRAAGLLALVALEPGVTRGRAAALLWPDSDNARQALRQQISRFKRNYGAELIAGTDALFIVEGIAVDAQQAGGGQLLGNQSFDDCEDFNTWLAQQRAQRHGGATAALAQQIAAAEAQGDLESAARLAEQLLLADNDSEAHHRTLMRLHYLRGDIAQAQTVYDRLVRQLAQRFGAKPSAETEQLARALRSALVAPRGAAPAATRPVPVTVLRPPRMIGRQRELAALTEAWQGGRAALLVGEPGLGKSRLLAEFATGRRVASVQGRPGDAGVPYATLARLLRVVLERAAIELPAPRRTELARLLPELAPSVPLPADGQRLLLQGAVEALLAQAGIDGAPIEGMLIDDLHFADDASVEMLQALINAEALHSLRWALAQRPGEGSAAAITLRGALEEAQALAPIALAPLTEAQMAELIDSLSLPELDAEQLAPQLVRHTGGNPLYALETLKQGLASGTLQQGRLPTPVNVGALIERRLKQLSERALGLARAAAIAGVDFSIALAEEVMGARALELADAWSELEAAQVLREDAFAHDLVYDAVLRSIPTTIARHLHGAVAAHLGRHKGVPARVAAHWLAAGEQREALPWLGLASQHARTGLRRREELQFLLTQADIEDRLGERGAAFETFKLAHAAQLAVDPGEAGLRPIFDALKRLALTPQQCIDIDNMRAADLINEGRHVDAEALARRTLAAAGRCDYEMGCASSMSTLSMALSMQGRLSEALAVVEQFWPVVERLPDPDPDYFNTYAVLLDNLGRPRDAIPLHRQAFEIAQRCSDSTGATSLLGNLAVSQMECGFLNGAQHTLERAEALRRAHDRGEGLSPTMMLPAQAVERALGHYDRALVWADRAQDVLSQSGSGYLPLVDLGRAAIWTDLGQFSRAQKALPEVGALLALPSWLVARRWQYAARLWLALGRDPLQCIEAAVAALGDESLLSARESVTLQLATLRGTLADLDALFAVGSAARSAGRDGTALAADLRAADLAVRLGMLHAATTHADRGRALLAADRDSDDAVTATDLSDAEAWLMLGRAYAAAKCAVDAADAFARGADWVVQTASEHVAPEFRDSFLHRNPVNRDLLAAARKYSQLAGGSARRLPAAPR